MPEVALDHGEIARDHIIDLGHEFRVARRQSCPFHQNATPLTRVLHLKVTELLSVYLKHAYNKTLRQTPETAMYSPIHLHYCA